MKIKIIKTSIIFIMIICLSSLSILTISAAEVKYQHNKKEFTYDGVKLSVYYNDNEIKLNKTSGIIIDGNALLPYQEVFVKSDIKAKVKYNKNTKKITIKHAGNTVKLTLNSKTAYVNGIKTTAPTAPIEITYTSNNKTRILVPSRFVAENLGLKYSWFSSTGTIKIEAITETIVEENYTTISFTKLNNKLSDITATDDYHNRQFIITLPGNQLEFYTKNTPSITGNDVVSVEVSLNKDKNTDINITTKTIKAFVIKELSKNIVIEIKSPKSVYSNIAVLDAGHGGKDPGTDGFGLLEKDINLSIIQYAKEYLDKEESIKVYYTRLDDTYLTLPQRVALANEVEADMFISIHINSAKELPDVRGSEASYSLFVNQKSLTGLTSSKLTTRIIENIVNAMGSTNRGVKKDDYEVINTTNMPATLVEVGFISNEEDVKILSDKSSLQKIGKAISKTIIDITKAYPTDNM